MVKVPSRDPVAAEVPSRHPFQVLLLFAIALSGAGSVFDFGPPQTLVVALPDYAVSLWGLINLCAGVVGLLGAFWPDRITGILMERLALSTLALPEIIYGGLAYYKNGAPAWTLSVLAIGFGVACMVRVWQTRGELNKQRAFLAYHVHWGEGEGSDR